MSRVGATGGPSGAGPSRRPSKASDARAIDRLVKRVQNAVSALTVPPSPAGFTLGKHTVTSGALPGKSSSMASAIKPS